MMGRTQAKAVMHVRGILRFLSYRMIVVNNHPVRVEITPVGILKRVVWKEE